LDFVYQVKVAAGPDSVTRVTASSYTGFTTDVGYSTSGFLPPGSVAGGVTPATVDRSLSGPGKVVGFNFIPNIDPGGHSILLVIETNADAFKPGTLSLIDAFTFSSTSFYAPAVVPEP